MPREIIKTDKAALPIGPYNQATAFGNIIFTSGQIAIDPKTNQLVDGTVEEQAKVVLQNLKAILEAAGSDFKHVLKATIFLKNMSDFPKVNEIYKQHFDAADAPARSTIEVARLPKDVLVEIEAIAVKR